MESIRHSSFAADPSGVPSSKNARRYHSPSQASLVQGRSQRRGPAPPARRALRFPAPLGDAGELRQVHVEEPAQPDALAPSLVTDAVHAVVPVAGAHQRQAVAAHRRGSDRGPARSARRASRGLRDTRGLEVRDPARPPPGPVLEQRHRLVEHARVAAWSAGSGAPRRAARAGRRRSASARRGPTADATSAGRRPPRNCRDAARRMCSRTRSGRVTARASTSCSWSRNP